MSRLNATTDRQLSHAIRICNPTKVANLIRARSIKTNVFLTLLQSINPNTDDDDFLSIFMHLYDGFPDHHQVQIPEDTNFKFTIKCSKADFGFATYNLLTKSLPVGTVPLIYLLDNLKTELINKFYPEDINEHLYNQSSKNVCVRSVNGDHCIKMHRFNQHRSQYINDHMISKINDLILNVTRMQEESHTRQTDPCVCDMDDYADVFFHPINSVAVTEPRVYPSGGCKHCVKNDDLNSATIAKQPKVVNNCSYFKTDFQSEYKRSYR